VCVGGCRRGSRIVDAEEGDRFIALIVVVGMLMVLNAVVIVVVMEVSSARSASGSSRRRRCRLDHRRAFGGRSIIARISLVLYGAEVMLLSSIVI